VLFHVARHARGANGTLRLATRRRVLAIQPLDLGGLLVIEHAPEIVVVFHALVPADRLSCREGSLAKPADRTHSEDRMRTAGTITPA
jgi:hypothetical protein